MLKSIFTIGLIFFSATMLAQQSTINGSVKDAVSFQPISNVSIYVEGTSKKTLTDVLGDFNIFDTIPLGEQILNVAKVGYVTKRFPIVVDAQGTIILNDITLERDLTQSQDLFTITLSDEELDNDTSAADNISGLLSSSLDVFQRTAAFEFSQSFFKLRGLDAAYGTVLINGIPMNKQFDGRPQWSNWGGLNDVMRNQELTFGLAPSNYNYGGVLGTANINVRASEGRQGARLTYSSSNRSYTNRLMATYSSGLLKNNWAYTISLGKRWGNEGYQEATFYDANSIFFSVEKKLSNNHSLNLTGIYAPNRRGKSSPNTQEVFNLKNIRYNEYWGWQNGKKRNSRVKHIAEPIVMLNHYWDLSSKTKLNTNLAYQFGKLGNSRLDNNGTDLVNGVPEGGGINPSPSYYQKLPSYFERNFPNDLQFAYMALQEFQNNGQIKWNELYQANIANAQNGGNAIYALYEDRVDDNQFTVNSILNSELNDNTVITAGINVQSLKSKNYAKVSDLLGAISYLDIDQFADDINKAQNDLQNPNRLVGVGDTFKYNYNLFATTAKAFVQVEFQNTAVEGFIATNLSTTQYQREGLYQNGAFPTTSLGKGKILNFMGFGGKGGLTYKLSGKHLLNFNTGYLSKPPSLRNTYTNARENHNIVPNISTVKLLNADISYVFRSPLVKAKVTGYYTKIKDANEISFFFADGIGGDNVAFVQEILQGIDKLHIGAELGIETQLTSSLMLKGVASVGQFTYANNPNLYLTSEVDNNATTAGFVNGFKDFGTTNLKHYKLSAGPHRAYSLGFEYRDPEFWWFGASANVFTNTYLEISPLTRSLNFTTDFDGNTFNDYDEALARELLEQERFNAYTVVNLIGGKSWKIGKSNNYISVFASINNLLNTVFKTGGFEQGRNANFRELRNDNALNTPVFGPKYWYGRGTTYFFNINYKF